MTVGGLAVGIFVLAAASPGIRAPEIAAAAVGPSPAVQQAGASAQGHSIPSADTLLYDLRPGDHIVYRETLVEAVDGRTLYASPSGRGEPAANPHLFEMRAAWTVHLIVLETAEEGLTIGIQRNRTNVEVTGYEAGGEDRTDGAREPLLARRAPSAEVFAHALRVTRSGRRLSPPEALREWPSKALWALDELPELPIGAVTESRSWAGDPLIGLRYRAAGSETIGDEMCRRVDGSGVESRLLSRSGPLPDTLRLGFWACPASGLVRRVEFDGAWPDGIFRKVRQTIAIELVVRHRKEELGTWLAGSDTRSAALEALALATGTPVPHEALSALLPAANEADRRRILGLIYRLGGPVPPSQTLTTLLGSPDARVRALVVRLLARVPEAPARPLLDRAAQDEDYFVREAALAAQRGRASRPVDLTAATAAAGDSGAATSEHGDAGPACGDPAAWLARHVAERRAPPQPPGLTLRRMTTPRFRGWPYAVHVPEDYRGDRPFPLLVYLAGNAGPVMEGVMIGGPAAAESGYLVVFPEASGAWWQPHATAAFDALLLEVHREFHVDPERVYLSGLSNGGTGTWYYATHWPHRFTAAVSAMGGGALVSFDVEPFPANSSWLPFLFLHGERDATITPEATRLTVERMRGRQAPLEAHYFRDRGHSLALGRGDDGRTFAFLQKHEGRALPRRLEFRTRSLDFARHYWLEVLEVEDRVAEVKAEVRDDGRVELETRGVKRLRLLLPPELLPPAGEVRVRWNGRDVFAGALAADCRLLRESVAEVGDPRLAWAAALELPAAP